MVNVNKRVIMVNALDRLVKTIFPKMVTLVKKIYCGHNGKKVLES